MKKIYITLFSILLTISVFAQDNTQHLTFKGIQIDGTLTQFIVKMNAAGFTYERGDISSALFRGEFAGYNDCQVIVSTFNNVDLVTSVGVLFPENTTWKMLEANYLRLKDMLTIKYGQPYEVVEEFHFDPPKEDAFLLNEVKRNRCTYRTIFSTEKGTIILELIPDIYLNCHVWISYSDSINSHVSSSAAMEDL